MALIEIAAQQTLNRIRHFVGRATITHRAAEACVLAYGAAKAEVVGILNAAINLELLAFQSDIGNAVLAATVWAACHIQFQLLIKLRNALFQLLNQPAGEGFRFCYRQLAELAAGASYSATPERRGRNMKSRSFKAKSDGRGACVGHVYNHQVLCVRGTKLPIAIALRQVGGRP
jgi:hypothetical protein